MIGKQILHFKVTEKLGEGGMGVVYKADDLKLHRTVALKFLSTMVTDRPGEQERLVNEARAAAGLQHPNICTIYEINEHDDQTFIAMSYIHGVTLRDRVLSSPIAVEDALKITLQIAQGLEHAHNKGLIHRDIKSANIMVDDVLRAFIMDFGLARRHDQVKPDEVLSSGGTSAYMSPEQALGEGVDQRTDIWSLGVVLYEMLAGELPFRGDYEQAVRYSIVNEEPKPLLQLRPGVPDRILAIIDKCMKKNRADRYQSVSELIKDLKTVMNGRQQKRWTAGGRARSQARAISIPIAALVVIVAAFVVYDLFFGKSAESDVRIPIAVIDFNNETDVPALDGLSGMLITALEQSRRLSVMTRTRMFDELKVMGRNNVERIDESLGQELCKQTGVGALVIPTIHKFGNKYTIDLKVLDTRRNEYIFTTKEEGQGQESIPHMIDEIAKNIRIDLQEETEVVEENTQNVADLTTVSLEAYKHYFEGERLLSTLHFDEAGKEFEKAIELDSTFALAEYRLAYTQWWMHHDLETAAGHVRRAMEMIDRIPSKEQLLVRALNAGLEDGFAAQMPFLRKMQKQYPDDKEMLFGIGDISFHTEQYDSAQLYFERVLELDPEFERALQHLTWTYLRMEKVDEAYEMAKRWAEVTGSWEAYQYLGNASFLRGDTEEAIAHYKKAKEISPYKAYASQALAQAYLMMGQNEPALAELQSVMTGDFEDKEKYLATVNYVGNVLPYLGRYEEAMQLTEIGLDTLQARGDSTTYLVAVMGKAGLYYWGWQDTLKMWKTIESTYDWPDEVKNNDYWLGLAAFNLIAGHTEEGDRIFKKYNKEELATPLFESLKYDGIGDCDAAEAQLDSAQMIPEANKSNVRFLVALCLYERGEYERVIDQLEIVVDPKNFTLNTAPTIPKSHYLLGKCYERIGKTKPALAHYEAFLGIWKNADENQHDLIDARNRLAAIKAAGSM